MSAFAIIALVLSAVAAIGSGVASYANVKKTNQANQEQYEDWKAYNDPSAQMDRLSNAGLNPYMISSVNNTLSQPYQFGQNSGIAEALQGVSQTMAQGGNMANDAYQRKLDREIKRDNLQLNRDKLDLQKEFTELRKDMMRSAIRKGDAQAALFWSSADNKDIVNNFLKQTMPLRVGSAVYDYLNKGLDYNYNSQMYPLKLQFYAPYQRALINNINARTQHLSWYEQFAQEQFLFEQEMRRREYVLNKGYKYDSLLQQQEQFYDRLRLSDAYQSLAYNKWATGMLGDIFSFGFKAPLKSVTRGGAGQLPTWMQYQYGY